MIQKQLIQSIISKYYLNGNIESVKWDITDNELNIAFSPPTKDMVGFLKHTEFPLENNIICISNTSQLNKLLNITGNEINIEQPTPDKLLISDSNFDIEYSLADPLIIPKTGTVKEPPSYDVEINLTNEDIDNLIKAKNALPDEDTVIIKSNKKTHIELSFGSSMNYSNKIKYSLPCENNLEPKTSIPFNSNLFKEILVANKASISAKLNVFSKGLMKFNFTHENSETTYYLIRKSDS